MPPPVSPAADTWPDCHAVQVAAHPHVWHLVGLDNVALSSFVDPLGFIHCMHACCSPALKKGCWAAVPCDASSGPMDSCKPSGCAGCQHALHCSVDGYVTMVYHLVQACDAPVVIRDQAWYLKQLEDIMDRNFEGSTSRAFYMFDDKCVLNGLEAVLCLLCTCMCMCR